MGATTQACRIRRINERLDTYRITKLIGTGGAARTYEAVHRKTNRRVALKTLAPEACKDERIVEGFVLEARLASELSHPNLAACLDVNLDADPPWIAFELVEGASLADVIRENDFLDPFWACNLAIDLAYGLAAAHQKDVMHRDIKPSNILFSADGQVKLIDFGAAYLEGDASKAAYSGLTEPTVTHQSGFTGTLVYAAPEQLKGEELDVRADLYSLGLVIYEMLTGVRLLQPEVTEWSMELHMRVFAQQANLQETMALPSELRPGIPKELDAVIHGLLAFRPRERAYSSAIEVIQALTAVMETNGWHSPHKAAQRQNAHHELAEVAYWRARSCLEEDKFGQAVSLLASLTHHPKEIADSYEKAIRRGMYQVFANQCLCHIQGSPGLGQLLDWLTAFKKMVDVGSKMDDVDMGLLAERRFLTIADWLSDREDRKEAVTRYFSENPSSVAGGLRAIEALTESSEDGIFDYEDIDEMRSALVRACIDDGWFSKALSIILEGTGTTPSLCKSELGPIVERVRAALAPWKLFDNVRRNLKQLGHTRALVQLCHRFVEDHPGNKDAWLELGRAYQQLGLNDHAAAALFEAGRICFRRDQLADARELFTAVLHICPMHDQAFQYLFEVLYAEGQLPTTFNNSDQLRVGILCKEKLVKSARSALLDSQMGAISQDFLRTLQEIAHDNGDEEMAAELRFHLGRICLNEGCYDEGLEYFLSSLETSPDPAELLSRMEDLRDIRKLFTPLELLNLRRELADVA